MSSKVSDMVKMYSQSNLRPSGDKPVGVVRKWPPVATSGGGAVNKPPPMTPKPKPAVNGASTLGRPATVPKPNFGSSDNKTNENIPAWRQELDRRRAGSGSRDENISTREVPSWKKPEEPKKPAVWNRPKPEANYTPNGLANSLPKKTPPKPDLSAKPSSLWGDRSKINVTEEDVPALPPQGAFKTVGLDSIEPKRATSQNKSFSYNTMPKAAIEKSSGSFSSPSPTHTRKTSETSPQHRVSSFLHTKPSQAKSNTGSPPPPPAADKPLKTNGAPHHAVLPPPPPAGAKPQKMNGVPRKLPIPSERFSEPPPLKSAKPPHVVLPFRGKKKSPPLPPPPSPIPSRPLPSPLSRDLPPPLGFPRPKEPAPPELPGRPLPSITPVRKAAAFPLPPPPTEVDDIYDDPGEEPPPPLPPIPGVPPLLKRESSGMIPTWDDEAEDGEDGEAIYDETPDEPPAKSFIPIGFPMPGNIPQIPEDNGEDMYEDVEEYMRLKKLHEQKKPDTASVHSNEGKDKKKKKDSDKKEKNIRKQFKLSLEGEIVSVGHGIVKENCRGWGKNLAVSTGDNIDIIRMTDNPKGKYLIRNSNGEYGYVDTDKITINIDQLRSTFGVGNKAPSGIGGGPPVPHTIMPSMGDDDDGEAIYDQTAEEEDIYEEV